MDYFRLREDIEVPITSESALTWVTVKICANFS